MPRPANTISLTAPKPDSTAGRRAIRGAHVPASVPARAPLSAATAFVSPDRVDFLRTAIRRPLCSVWGACLLLDCQEDRVEKAVESGELEWAFDIRGKGAHTRNLRILTACVFDLREKIKPPRRSLENVINSILPKRPALGITESCFNLHCASWHLVKLIHAGLIKRFGPKPESPKAATRIDRASLADFLCKRREA